MKLDKKIEAIEWKDDYNLDSEFLDAKHKSFIDTINLLVDQINERKCTENFGSIFHRLAYYAEKNFLEEEDYFASNMYPGLQQHRQAHVEFTNKLIDFYKRYSEDGEIVCYEMFKYLKNWMEEHIQAYDRKAIKYINSDKAKE